MCGIFGYVGSQKRSHILIEGLKSLEYRGYDSAGVATFDQNQRLNGCKVVGKVANLQAAMNDRLHTFSTAIAHTRWATHGAVTENNAHPHFDSNYQVALVHNGIIENHDEIRRELEAEGTEFLSETDSETIVHLLSKIYEGDIVAAVEKLIAKLKGSYALAIIHETHPEQVVVVKHQSPLVVGFGKDEMFISSDPHAFAPHTDRALFLNDMEIALISKSSLDLFFQGKKISAKMQNIDVEVDDISKGQFDHFTLKEIYEQPKSFMQAIDGRYSKEYGTAIFEELEQSEIELQSAERILILACGTSWHAGLVASYMLEDKARIPVQVEISSEFRYKNPIILPHTLVIALSQSGETADTIAAVREVQAKGAKVLAICNIKGSTLAREADCAVFLKAGKEIGVCSTKAYTNQVAILTLFTLMMARMRHMGKVEGQQFIESMLQIPAHINTILAKSDEIKFLADKYGSFENFFYLGRCYMFPSSLEGALKLKEISYVNANGYPAGEMKHGPIALISSSCLTVALGAHKNTFEKFVSNLMEIKARQGKVLAIISEKQPLSPGVADDTFIIPDTIDELSPLLVSIFCQLFAYNIAKGRGADIDQPKNLAKSVTVE